jgi:hypothetical protein
VVGSAFGSFFLGLQEDGTISCHMIYISLVVHALQMFVLASATASPSVRVAASRVVVIAFRVESPIHAFWLWRAKLFFPVFWWSASVKPSGQFLGLIVMSH